MPLPVITTMASLMCPHGGKVTVITTNTKVLADSAPAALQSDVFTVAGCPFTLPGPKPSPCITVRWDSGAQKVQSGGTAVLTMASSGTCYSAEQAPQGPVIILSAQGKVTGT
jgi:hypothetical protein